MMSLQQACVPLFLALLFPVTFITTYWLALSAGDHLKTGSVSFISDAGSEAPERCVFGQLLNLAAFIMSVCVYIRYRQLQTYDVEALSKAALWTGLVSALGVSMVGNFQFSAMPLVHAVGALMTFGVGIASLWIQVALTYYDPPDRFSPALIRLRCLFASLASLGFVVTFTGAGTAFVMRGAQVKSPLNYTEGYVWLVAGVLGEWGMALSMAAFIATFYREASAIKITPPQIVFADATDRALRKA